MNFEQVTSSQVHSVGYDPKEQKLGVRYRCQPCMKAPREECPRCIGTNYTGTYFYDAVPGEVHGLVALGHHSEYPREAVSVGKAINQHIKKGGYKFTFVPHEVE